MPHSNFKGDVIARSERKTKSSNARSLHKFSSLPPCGSDTPHLPLDQSFVTFLVHAHIPCSTRAKASTLHHHRHRMADRFAIIKHSLTGAMNGEKERKKSNGEKK